RILPAPPRILPTIVCLRKSAQTITGTHVCGHPKAGVQGGTERCYGAGGEEMATSSLHEPMECRDAPAERLEQVPRRPGPKSHDHCRHRDEPLELARCRHASPRREPWNKGKLIGQKPPLRPKHVWSIRPDCRWTGARATWRCSISQ